jgi:hypothetical protein
MNSDAVTSQPVPSKTLRQLGRDEMNLAEFPITLLTDRVPKDQKEAVYQDEIYDGLPIAMEKKPTIFRMTVVQVRYRKRWFPRTAKPLRRVCEILRDHDSR